MSDPRIAGFAELLASADPGSHDALIARAKMLAMSAAAPEAFEAPISTLGSYLEQPIEVPPILISSGIDGGLLVRGSVLATIGRAGKGKTQMNLNRNMRLACGEPMFKDLKDKDGGVILGHPEGEPLKILVIENEGAAGMFHKQIGIMLHAEGWLTNDQRDLIRENILIWGDGGYSGLKLDDQKLLNQVRGGVEKWEPDIVFIEPFRGLWSGDENSATDMALVADALSALSSDYNLGTILTHHERKSGGGEDGEKMSAGRGSTVLEAFVATMENFEVARGGDFRELSWSKIRYGGGYPLLPVRMEWQPGAWWYRHVPMAETEQMMLSVMAESPDEPMTIAGLIEATDESDGKVRKTMKKLVDDGKVKKMSAEFSGAGSTGNRYRLIVPNEDAEGEGGMDF